MSFLATIDDYVLRHGAVADTPKVEQLLADASSMIREEARQTISRVVDDVETFEGTGANLLCLSQLPVVDVTAITVDDADQAATTWRLLPYGQIRRRGCGWPCEAIIEVTYTHGWDVVPDWVVSLVCSTVQRALRPSAVSGVQGVTTGSQNVQYAASLAGVNLWLTHAEVARLRGLGPPVVG